MDTFLWILFGLVAAGIASLFYSLGLGFTEGWSHILGLWDWVGVGSAFVVGDIFGLYLSRNLAL